MQRFQLRFCENLVYVRCDVVIINSFYILYDNPLEGLMFDVEIQLGLHKTHRRKPTGLPSRLAWE